MNNCSKLWAKPHRKVKTEYHRIAICSEAVFLTL
jgi:hypothetical protein